MNYGKDGQNNTASTTETGSTVINDNPAVHTAKENANIAKYSAAANEVFNAATAQQVRIDDIAGKIYETPRGPYTLGKQKTEDPYAKWRGQAANLILYSRSIMMQIWHNHKSCEFSLDYLIFQSFPLLRV